MDLFPPPAHAQPHQDLNVAPMGGNLDWEPWPDEQGCSRPMDKGKGVRLPSKLTLQDFVQATTADQVAGINDQAEALEGVLRITAREVQEDANATE
ncbi:hypothetical protein GUJ93_ZPchr0002g26544 [Zizania palustris]|uniref:Uncharacterized protein n=1 Tax=Zizania palustris TaxID=103762 RepID=A0A8J5S1L6_ZIZPA|nr:hypothetical protein GUJ93_ZPchr0002g26544 [Zizania palustris]